MGVRLKRGRFFTDADNATAPAVVIVDSGLPASSGPDATPSDSGCINPM